MTTNRKTTMLAVGAMLALAGAGVAGAATKAAPAATQAACDALTRQADSALTTHKTSSKATTAQHLRDAGSKECKAGNYAKGAEHLRQAITDLGMKPVD